MVESGAYSRILDALEDMPSDIFKAWDPAQHPRDPGGEGGGQFVSGAGGAGGEINLLETMSMTEALGGHAGTPADPAPCGAAAKMGVMAQWSNGTIFLYGDTVGDPNFLADNRPDPGWGAWDTPEGIITHEFGHQVWMDINWDINGFASDINNKFTDALIARPSPDAAMSEIVGWDPNDNVEQISGYAAASSPDEAMAEAFALVNKPGFDLNDYTGGARDALQILLDRLDKDTKGKT